MSPYRTIAPAPFVEPEPMRWDMARLAAPVGLSAAGMLAALLLAAVIVPLTELLAFEHPRRTITAQSFGEPQARMKGRAFEWRDVGDYRRCKPSDRCNPID
jgi:hypothetical protein